MENSVAIATELTVTALREYTYGLPPGTLLDQFEALLSGLINGKIAIKDLEKANNDAASVEQARQDNMKPFILHGVENLPGFVAKKKNTEKNEAYYTKIILNALEDVEDELIYGDDELERDLHELKTKLISGKMVLVEDTDMQPGDDIGYNEQDGIAGNLCSIRKKEETVAVEKEEDFTIETRRQKLEKETKLILKAVDGYRMLLFTMPSNGVYDANLVAELGKLFEDLSDGDIILVDNEEKEALDFKKEKTMRTIETPEKSTEVNSHTIPHPSPLGLEFTEVSSSGKTDTEYRNSTDGENEDDDLLGSEDEYDDLRKILVENLDTSDDNNILRVRSTFSAFIKKLKRIKGKKVRTRKSIVKVITETTIDEFETQLTKYTNDGYKIKYVNINTKAGNSGSGVRYYAVVQHG